MQDELWAVANVSRPLDKATAAAYFEELGEFARAVELYHRAGYIPQAIEMAFASQQPEILQVIAAELNKDSDPELVNRCAEFFLQSQQNQKAVSLLATNRQFKRALNICSVKGVPITEDLADRLTPTKEELDESQRLDILTELGVILQQQGDYHLATKKFTQAGDKIKAMKSLLKSGDTDKIIFFASMSRQKEIYIMGANYLQALDYQSDPKILKNIIQFYNKANAFDLLSNFYARAAQIEVTEFRDYDKALKALIEASKTLLKVPNTQKMQDTLQLTIDEVRKVVELYEMAEHKEYEICIASCRNILMSTEKPPIRHVHVLALLVECLIDSKQYSDALVSFKELVRRASEGDFKEFLDKGKIERLTFELGIDFDTVWTVNINSKTDVESEAEEEIVEVFD